MLLFYQAAEENEDENTEKDEDADDDGIIFSSNKWEINICDIKVVSMQNQTLSFFFYCIDRSTYRGLRRGIELYEIECIARYVSLYRRCS